MELHWEFYCQRALSGRRIRHKQLPLELSSHSKVASSSVPGPHKPQRHRPVKTHRRLPAALPAPEEKTSVTHHTARIGGQEINYTATAGTFVINADNGTPKATFFYVAYTKDGVSDVAQRPVSIVYNGGPGSASLFTHMGFGPKRVVLTPDGHGMPAPYKITDNEDSFLDSTDLVFVDAVSTGYSRPVPVRPPPSSTASFKMPTTLRTSSTSTSPATAAGTRQSI